MNLPTTPLETPAAWLGADKAASADWIHRLSEAEIAELDAAVAALRQTGKPVTEITAEDYPLSVLRAPMRAWVNELEHGAGFKLIRGLPVHRYTEEDAARAYWLLSVHVGEPVAQNEAGDRLGHVRDDGADPADPNVRLYRTRAKQDFHTDGADLIGLLCLRTARSGGKSRIVSSVSVVNEIMRRRPDLVPALFEPLHWDRKGGGADAPRTFVLPICTYGEGRLQTFFIRWYIEQAQRFSEVPRLTEAQREVIALLEAIANEPSVHLDMELEPGDIQLLENSVILHARTAYEDWDEPDQRRHLLRVWLTARELTGGNALLRHGVPSKGHEAKP